MTKQQVAGALKFARREKNMTIRQLSKKVDLSANSICAIENGANFTVANLIKICDELGLKVAVQLAESDK